MTDFILFILGRNNFVYISDPNALESIFRVEGKYPRREATLSPSLYWIMNKLDFAVPLPFKYYKIIVLSVTIYRHHSYMGMQALYTIIILILHL